ncbi:hypothetical protein KOL96_10290 [Ralstonia wenshanensis]|uniref:hypothetical protein n=1 Tax=Ralstonia wenshanensis TaxID=2842456 RepID=UPI001E618332|nr:hypothetical protein [Ralstonia wenshanensis]UGS91496.1 hypothetical protein KOL96_10290 [Ralstonia wenshanensis]
MSQENSGQERLVALRESIEVHRPHLRVDVRKNRLAVWVSVEGNSELRAVRLLAMSHQSVFDLKRAASSRAEHREVRERFDGSLEQLLSIIDSEVELIGQRAATSAPTCRRVANGGGARPERKAAVGGNALARAERSQRFAPEVVEPVSFSLALPYAYRWEIFTADGERGGVFIGIAGRKGPPVGYSRTRRYWTNVENLLAGKPYASNPGRPYRKVHNALADAVRAGQRIVLTYLQNPAEGESLDELERRLIREHDSFGPLAHQLNGTL